MRPAAPDAWAVSIAAQPGNEPTAPLPEVRTRAFVHSVQLVGVSIVQSTWPYSALASHWSPWRPLVPFLVMIWITPFAASAPYSVAAAGPFTTSIDSMSSGLMKSSGLRDCPDTP